MYKEDLTLNNHQWLICLKTNSNQTIYYTDQTKYIQLLCQSADLFIHSLCAHIYIYIYIIKGNENGENEERMKVNRLNK